MQVLKETNSYRLALKDRILDTAIRLFMTQGIRAVKMDDIAQQLAISKRTLYEIYADKEELLYQSIAKYDRQRAERMADFVAQGHNVVDIILESYRIKVDEVHNVNSLFYEDILKYPKVAQYIRENHEEGRQKFLVFMQQGVSEGIFRPDVNCDMVPMLLDAIGHYIMTNGLLHKYSVEELFANFFLVSLRGLCTEHGVKALDEAMAKV